MTAKQEALLKKAHRSLEAASRLLRDGDPDFAVSRAYYAMFYAAEALLLSRDLSFRSHAAVISAVGQHFAATGVLAKEHHQNFIAAQYARSAGDYWTEEQLSDADVAEHLRNAESLIAAIETLLKT